MTQAVAVANPADRIVEVLVSGNLGVLKSEERLEYYERVCRSLGLNPLTKPFEYLTLNGKLVMYATKACSEQLRQIHGISISITEEKRVDDLYMVKVSATDKTGRIDSDMGVVSIGNLKGENLANAILKATTKAKRRVTLSICGLGMLDETEVEDIPERAKRPAVVMPQSRISAPAADPETGEVRDAWASGDMAAAMESDFDAAEPVYAWMDDLKAALAGAPIKGADIYQALGVANGSNREKAAAIDSWLNPAIGQPREAGELVKFVADWKARQS